MSSVRAKFKCTKVEVYEASEKPTFIPVYGNSPENKSFSTATPVGELTLMITVPALFGYYRPGREYYLDITEVKPASEYEVATVQDDIPIQ